MEPGLLQCLGQPFRRLHPGDAEGGTGPDRLDKERITQGLGRGGNLRRVRTPGEDGAPGHVHPGPGRQLVGPVLVHGQGAGQGAAADDRDARQLQQALERAVLAVFAVHHREGRVKGQDRSAAVQEKQLPGLPVQPQGAGDAGPVLPAVRTDFLHRAGVAEPAARPGDARHQRRESRPVQVGENGLGRLQRYGVLAGDAAEYNKNGLHEKTSWDREIAPSGTKLSYQIGAKDV